MKNMDFTVTDILYRALNVLYAHMARFQDHWAYMFNHLII